MRVLNSYKAETKQSNGVIGMKQRFDKILWTRRALLIIYDVLAVWAASVGALLLRYNLRVDDIEVRFLNTMSDYFLIQVLITIGVFIAFHLYQSLWKYAGMSEFQNIVFACIVSTGLYLLVIKMTGGFMPRSYYPIYGMLLLVWIIGSRFLYRLLRYHLNQFRAGKSGSLKNVMVIGAGEAANDVLKEIIEGRGFCWKVKCLIDDDSSKLGRYVQGVKVVGNRNFIVEAAHLYQIDQIIIAMQHINEKDLKDILLICQKTGCNIKKIPSMQQIVSGEINLHQLQDISPEDLLGRTPVSVDIESIMGYVSGQVVMVTGGGGSIGSELCRQIASHKPKQLIIVDIYENNAYEIQQELLRTVPDLNLVVVIASVRNTNRINMLMKEYKPDIIYHAAAHKHVPLMEDSPNEAVKNNVFGTLKTAIAAGENGVKKFILISTDKAVNPTNIMGASKRICEMIVQTFNKEYDTEFVAVRFGNVLGSNGSVIPLFKKQIQHGGPVTVTHPDIIRYFMTISEAVSLVLQAGAYAKGGEIFVLDMGEPVKILDLAKNLIRLSGYVPDEDIKIVFTGLRPGEKLFEELLMDEEGLRKTDNKLIFIGKPIEIDEEVFKKQLQDLEVAAKDETKNIRKRVQEIVPTYVIKDKENDEKVAG